MSSSWAVSSNNLISSDADATQTKGKSRQLLQLTWQTISAKYQKLSDFLRRETNKTLPKELRRSLRLNKSARRKGYQQYLSETDKRILEEHLNKPINISIRIGPAYEYVSAVK